VTRPGRCLGPRAYAHSHERRTQSRVRTSRGETTTFVTSRGATEYRRVRPLGGWCVPVVLLHAVGHAGGEPWRPCRPGLNNAAPRPGDEVRTPDAQCSILYSLGEGPTPRSTSADGMRMPKRVLTSLTSRDASALLGISEGTLRAQVAKGRLAAQKLGRDLFFERAELERYAREVQRRRIRPP
jgi:excisionase family DNA binding protein